MSLRPQVPLAVPEETRRVARAAIARVLAWPVKAVVLAHGAPVTSDGAAFLVRAFRWLMR